MSGKTTVANVIRYEHRYMVLSFAYPLKSMLVSFLTNMGVETAERYLYNPRNKEVIIPEVGVTARYLMQTLGTEWGRKLISYDIWLKIMKQRIQATFDKGLNVIVDDMRFHNEYELLAGMGAYMVKIARPGAKYSTQHVSEGGLTNKPFDFALMNDCTLADLEDKALRMVGIINERGRGDSVVLA